MQNSNFEDYGSKLLAYAAQDDDIKEDIARSAARFALNEDYGSKLLAYAAQAIPLSILYNGGFTFLELLRVHRSSPLLRRRLFFYFMSNDPIAREMLMPDDYDLKYFLRRLGKIYHDPNFKWDSNNTTILQRVEQILPQTSHPMLYKVLQWKAYAAHATKLLEFPAPVKNIVCDYISIDEKIQAKDLSTIVSRRIRKSPAFRPDEAMQSTKPFASCTLM